MAFNPADFKTDFSHFQKAGNVLGDMFKAIPGALKDDEAYQAKKAELGSADKVNKQLYAELTEFAEEFDIDPATLPVPPPAGTPKSADTDKYATDLFAIAISAAKNKGVGQKEFTDFITQKTSGGAVPQVQAEQQALGEQQKLQQSIDFRTGQPVQPGAPQQQPPGVAEGPTTILDAISQGQPQAPTGPQEGAPGVGAIGQGGVPAQAFPGVEPTENILSRLAVEQQPPPPPSVDMTPAERRNFEREAADNDLRTGNIPLEKHTELISALNKQEATELKDKNAVQREKQKEEQGRQDDFRDEIDSAIANGTGVRDTVTGKFINDEGIDTKIKKLTERYVITGKEFSRRDELFRQRGGGDGGGEPTIPTKLKDLESILVRRQKLLTDLLKVKTSKDVKIYNKLHPEDQLSSLEEVAVRTKSLKDDVKRFQRNIEFAAGREGFPEQFPEETPTITNDDAGMKIYNSLEFGDKYIDPNGKPRVKGRPKYK